MDLNDSETPRKEESTAEKPMKLEDSVLQVEIEDNESNSLLKCSICPYTTCKKPNMEKHTNGHDSDLDGKMYKCPICHILMKGNLARHMSLHTKAKYNCRFCQKEYNRTDQMNEHMMTHIKKRVNFECPVSLCDGKFFLFTQLETHMDEIHQISAGNEAKCKICWKTFAKSKQLRMHFFTMHHEDSKNSSEPAAKKVKLDEGQNTGESSNDEFYQQFMAMIRNPASKSENLEIQIPDEMTSSEVSNSQTPGSGGSPAPEQEVQKLIFTQNYSNLPSASTSAALLASAEQAIPIVQYLPCDPCGIIFKDPFLYTLHKSLHSIDDPFKCALCGHQCENKYMFMVHTSTGNHS